MTSGTAKYVANWPKGDQTFHLTPALRIRSKASKFVHCNMVIPRHWCVIEKLAGWWKVSKISQSFSLFSYPSLPTSPAKVGERRYCLFFCCNATRLTFAVQRGRE